MRHLLKRVGRRGSFLLFLSMLDFVYAFSFFNPPLEARRSATLTYLDSLGNLKVWGILWGVAGLFALYYAFKKRDAIGFTACMIIKTLWAVVFLLGWLFADVERGYLSAVIWGSFAIIVYLISSWPDEFKNVS